MRDFIYVDDCVEATLLTATEEKANGLALDIGGTEPVSLKELAAILISLHKDRTYVIKEFPAERKK